MDLEASLNARDRQRMTQGNQVRRALRAHDRGDTATPDQATAALDAHRLKSGPEAGRHAVVSNGVVIRRAETEAGVARALADMLIDCVEGGASVGFTLPLDHGRAEASAR